MNIDVSDFGLYLNIAFFSVLLIGLIFGLIRGFRKSLYRFIITLIFFAVFFLTVNAVVGWFYTANIGFLNNLYSQYLPIQGEITSIQDVVHLFLVDAIGEGASIETMGDEVMALIDALGTFVVKIVYTIIYFTVFQIIYRFILFIVGLFIFAKGRAKNKKGKRNRPMGAVFGTLTAALNLFVMLIVLSGIMSIGESLATLEIDNVPSQVSFEPDQYSRITDINDSLQPVGRLRYEEMAENDPNTQLTEALDSLKSLIEVYNSNIVIQGLNAFQVEDEFTGENENMAIVLFDEVISINYKDEKIDLRQDIKSFAEVASLYLNSDYYQSGDLSDITSQEITNAFSTLSDSKLLVSLIPVGIEFGINQMEESPIVIDDDFRNLIYEDINWKTEINQLGVVASAGFMILENANALVEGTEFKTVAFSPTLTETMFDELANSKIAEYGSFVALEYLMESNETLQSVITVPEDLNFADEFRAFGDIANEILSQNLTFSDIENAEGQDLLILFSGLDLEVLMNSKLTTNALVNILTGQTTINIDIEFLEIPNISRDEWFDTIGSGGEREAGELRHILSSISILTSYLDDIDLDDIQPADLGVLTESDIDSMFESKVLVASISNAITTLDTGGFTLVIPDSVLDLDGYIKKDEVKSLLKSITLIVEATACDPGDETCSDTGFDIGKAFSLSPENIRKLLAENVNPDDENYESQIFYATAANMLTEMTDQVVVPNEVKVNIDVNNAPLEIVSRTEILNAFLAIKEIGITDIENTDFDASLLLNLSEESDSTTLDTRAADVIFASKILHATISKFLLDQTGDNATVIVPILAPENYEGTELNRVLDTVGEVEYITKEEFIQILEAVLLLQLDDFTNLDIAPADLLEHAEELLDSAILHATITDQIQQQISGGAVTVPDTDVDGNALFITTSENDEYIVKSELNAIFNALDLLDISDFNSISLDTISLDVIITNDDDLLESAILHATISTEILNQSDAGTLSVPSRDLDDNLIIDPVNGTDFIVKSEIKNTLGALELLDIDDFTNVSVDIGILNKLSVDPITDPKTLNINDANTLLKSKIVHKTITDLIIDAGTPASVGEDPSIIVPYIAETNYNFSSDDYDYSLDKVRDYSSDNDEYIVEAEIIYLLKIILELEITDLESFSADDPEDPLLAKILPIKGILFDSAILQATISDQIINLESDDLVVPEKDFDGFDIIISRGEVSSNTETTYISRVELEAALTALEELNITDFTSVDLDDMTLILDKIQNDNLLDSSILHATISEKINAESEGGDLVVPKSGLDGAEIKKEVGTVTYISETEIIATLDALEVLDITDFNDLNINPSIIQNLGEYDAVDDRNELVPEKATTLFASKIVHATISKMIIDAGTPDDVTGDQQILVPYRAELNYDYNGYTLDEVRGYSQDDDEYIVEAELFALFNVIIALEISDLNDFNDGDTENPLLARIQPHRDILFDSAIIQATISDQIINLESNDLVVPEKDFNEVKVIDSKVFTDNDLVDHTDEYISKVELEAALVALEKLNITDFTSVNLDDMTLILDKIQNDNLLDSSILHATISEKINAESDSGDLVVPSRGLDDIEIKKEVENVVYISETEIIATLDALEVLGITDFTGLEIEPSIIQNLGEYDAVDDRNELVPEKATTLFASKIVHATISKMIFDAGTPDDISGDQQILVPYRAELNYNYNGYTLDEVRGYSQDDDEYIVEGELYALFNVIIALEITDLDDFNDNDPENPLLARIQPHRDILFDSAIIQATISDQLINLESDDLVVPSVDVNEVKVIDSKDFTDNDLISHTDEYISKLELEAALSALEELNITDLNSVNIDDFALISQKIKDENLLDSAILHATISQLILDADDGTDTRNLYIPDMADESYQNINVTYPNSAAVRYTSSESDQYIVKAELLELFEAISELNISSLDDVSTMTLSLINQKKSELLNSAILHATVSRQIFDLEATTDVVIPEVNELGNPIISEDNTDLSDIIQFLAKQEIEDLLAAIVLIDNDPTHTINDISGTVELSLFLPSQTTEADGNQEILFASSIMKATVSKQVFALEDGVSGILVPDVNQDEDSIIIADGEGDGDAYLIKDELKSLINATDLVTNMNQISDFDGNINLSVFFKSTYPSSPETATANQDTLLSSSIMQATISNKFKDLDNNQIYIPSVDVVDQDIEYDYTATGDYFIDKEEVKSLINVLDIVGFNNIESFDGVIDLSVFDNIDNQNALLASAIMHQTVSKKIIDNASLDVPNQGFKHDDNSVYTVLITKAANDFDFIEADDIRFLIDVMNLISTGGDVGSFTASVDTSIFADSGNQDILLKSAVMHYTVSNQIKDNNQLVVPELSLEADNITNETVIDLAGSDEFIVRDELKELIDVINLISSGSIDGFSSSFSLSTFATGTMNDPEQELDNQQMLLKSAIMHATISDQIIGMDDGTSSSVLIAPDYNFSDSQIKISATGSNLAITTTYYTQTEISNLIDGLNSLGLGSQSITSFDGGLSISTLNDSDVQEDLYASSILHATISNQIINNNSLEVPEISLESNLSNEQIIYVTTNSEKYILSSEITNLINVMNLISSGGNVNAFDSSFNLSTFASGTKNDPEQDLDNQEILLKSAIMHATISDQVIGMDDGTSTSALIVPDYDFSDSQVKIAVTGTNLAITTTYYTKSEIGNLIDGLNALGLGSQSITSFDGGLSISTINDSNVQSKLYASSILHATISNQIINNNSLDVPDYSLESNLSNVQIVYTTTASENYILSSEITALIDVMNLISTGGDVDGFDSNFSLSTFDTGVKNDPNQTKTNQEMLVDSAIMHATLSKQILDLPDEVLLVPTYTEDGALETNRIYHVVSLTANTTEYIIKSEIRYIINGFNQLGASDLGSYNSSSSINAGDFFSDISTYLDSSSFQATISKKILDGNSGNLIIPNRDETNTYDIQIEVFNEITSANMTYIESQEIEYLVNGLNELSITDFSSSVSPTSITTLTGGQLDTILLSGTLHLTIEDIIQGNGNISSDIPDKALDDLYNLTDILIKSEVKAFILASKAFAGNGADLSNIDFDFTTIAGKDETTRNTIIASMIVRNIITPEIESADASDPLFTLQASDYEDGLVSTFLTADGIRRYINHLNSL